MLLSQNMRMRLLKLAQELRFILMRVLEKSPRAISREKVSVSMATPDRLVTFDNNVLIDLRKNIDPVATYARRLLDFNREGKIVVATTISTMLEKQRTGEEMSMPELIAWLEEIGI